MESMSSRYGALIMQELSRALTDRLHFWRMGHTITVRLDRDLATWLAHESEKTGVSQGKIVRDQLEKAKATRSAQSFMRLAGVVRGGPRDVSTRKGFSRK